MQKQRPPAPVEIASASVDLAPDPILASAPAAGGATAPPSGKSPIAVPADKVGKFGGADPGLAAQADNSQEPDVGSVLGSDQADTAIKP